MRTEIHIGDIVKSLSGRDAGNLFLVISLDGNRAKIVDGKFHKILNPKIKNIKHLETVFANALVALADTVNSGEPVGNERLRKAIFAVKEKI